MNVPVIDIFAGPGGLGEGFAAYKSPDVTFDVSLSVEKDASAHRTLRLRKFFHLFGDGKAPDEYYRYVRGSLTEAKLIEAYPDEWNTANEAALRAELGNTEDDRRVDAKIRAVISRSSGTWVLVGGPPCQAYSLVGRARRSEQRRNNITEFESDERHLLYQEYLRVLARFQPTVFVMENVKGITSAVHRGSRIFYRILHDLANPGKALRARGNSSPGYTIYSLVRPGTATLFEDSIEPRDFVIHAEKYGIPQTRHRVILIGVRNDISVLPSRLTRSTAPLLGEIIGNLPPIRSELSGRRGINAPWRDAITSLLLERSVGAELDPSMIGSFSRNLQSLDQDLARGGRFVRSRAKPRALREWFDDRRLSGVLNHRARTHQVDDLGRYLFATTYAEVNGVSPRVDDFPPSLLPEHENVGADNGRTAVFADRFKVQLPDRPASTITSHISKDGHYYIHPDPSQCRSLTVREAARIQTFPDNYFFEGNRTQQYVQVGNAVPPYLANQIAAIVAEVMAAVLKDPGAVASRDSVERVLPTNSE